VVRSKHLKALTMSSDLPQARLRHWALALMWVLPLLWAVNIVAARQAPGVVSPHVLALGRWVLAGCILSGLSWRENTTPATYR